MQGIGLRVEGLCLRVEGLRFKVQSVVLRVSGPWCMCQGLGLRVEGEGERVGYLAQRRRVLLARGVRVFVQHLQGYLAHKKQPPPP